MCGYLIMHLLFFGIYELNGSYIKSRGGTLIAPFALMRSGAIPHRGPYPRDPQRRSTVTVRQPLDPRLVSNATHRIPAGLLVSHVR